MERLLTIRWQLALIALATMGFYGGLFVGRPLLSGMLLRMPENYEYLARRHLERADYDAAIEACKRELARYAYNFHAYYLQAEILRAADRHAEALTLLWGLPGRYSAIKARNVPSRGWSDARLELHLARVLWELRRYEEALDQLQLAVDWWDPHVNVECRDFVEAIRNTTQEEEAAWAYAARAIVDPKIDVAQAVGRKFFKKPIPPANFYARLAYMIAGHRRPKPPWQCVAMEFRTHRGDLPSVIAYQLLVGQFPPSLAWRNKFIPKEMNRARDHLMVGRPTFESDPEKEGKFYLTNEHWARIFRNAVVRGKVEIRKKARGICIIAKGTVCDEVWPVMSVWIDGRRIGRRYVRANFQFAYSLAVDLEPGTYEIGIGLENDKMNALTKHDRNLEVFDVRFY